MADEKAKPLVEEELYAEARRLARDARRRANARAKHGTGLSVKIRLPDHASREILKEWGAKLRKRKSGFSAKATEILLSAAEAGVGLGDGPGHRQATGPVTRATRRAVAEQTRMLREEMQAVGDGLANMLRIVDAKLNALLNSVGAGDGEATAGALRDPPWAERMRETLARRQRARAGRPPDDDD